SRPLPGGRVLGESMTSVRLYENPFASAAPRTFEVERLAAWVLDHYGDVPKVRLQIYRGEPSVESEISGNAEAILAARSGEYTILQSPGADFGIMEMAYIVMAVAAVAAVALMPKAVLPGEVGTRTQASPNNALVARENKVRIL